MKPKTVESPAGGTAYAWPTAESKKQAAEMLGWPVAVLTRVQKVGCPGFRHGRVYIGEVIKWMGTGGDDATDWGEVLKQEKALRERLKRQVEEKSSLPHKTVNEVLAKHHAEASRLLTVRLEQEYPALVQGLDIAGCRIKGKQLNDAIRAEMWALCQMFPE